MAAYHVAKLISTAVFVLEPRQAGDHLRDKMDNDVHSVKFIRKSAVVRPPERQRSCTTSGAKVVVRLFSSLGVR